MFLNRELPQPFFRANIPLFQKLNMMTTHEISLDDIQI